MISSGKKCLVAYYSRKGENYARGSIVHLPVGNTELIAKKIASFVQADLLEINTIKAYPAGYEETTVVARNELRNNARPELTRQVENMDAYEVVFLGYPNWWGTFPMAVFTFLESYNFSGKTIYPFCTHEGSGIGQSERDIQKLCPSARVGKGFAIRGSSVAGADQEVRNWLNGLE